MLFHIVPLSWNLRLTQKQTELESMFSGCQSSFLMVSHCCWSRMIWIYKYRIIVLQSFFQHELNGSGVREGSWMWTKHAHMRHAACDYTYRCFGGTSMVQVPLCCKSCGNSMPSLRLWPWPGSTNIFFTKTKGSTCNCNWSLLCVTNTTLT